MLFRCTKIFWLARRGLSRRLDPGEEFCCDDEPVQLVAARDNAEPLDDEARIAITTIPPDFEGPAW